MSTETMERARSWVDEARRFFILMGARTALAEFGNPAGMFTEGEMYVFVLSSNGVMLANGLNEKSVGKDLMGLTDPDGKQFIKEIVNMANAIGFGWVEYMWHHPVNGKIQPKVVYFEKVNDLILCSGAYSETFTGQAFQPFAVSPEKNVGEALGRVH